MLKERVHYKKELPIDLLVADIEEYPIHFHEDCEVVYVLKGNIELRDGYYNYTLGPGDIFIVNDGEMHGIKRIGNEPNMVMMLHLSFAYFQNYYPNLKNSFFDTEFVDSEESLTVLKSILSKIITEMLQKGYGYEHKIIEVTHNLISYLQADFQSYMVDEGNAEGGRQSRRNKIMAGRLSRITKYMYENYHRKLTLNEIGEKEHLSIYYLSHVIKNATGLSFQDLLSFIRVEESEKLLLSTKKKIGTIASETGFSAVRYYIKHFEKWYHMHPLEYREKYTGRIMDNESTAEMRRCSPQEIEEILHAQRRADGQEDDLKKYSALLIVDIDLEGEFEASNDGGSQLTQLISKPLLKPVAGPFSTILSLEEQPIAAGDNYIITTLSKYKKQVNSLSVLAYNVDNELRENLMAADNIQQVVDYIADYGIEQEFLLRCIGLTGKFRVSRYFLSKENCLMTYQRIKEKNVSVGQRQQVMQKWMSLPTVSFEEFTSADTLSLRTKMDGFSAELILIDRIE